MSGQFEECDEWTNCCLPVTVRTIHKMLSSIKQVKVGRGIPMHAMHTKYCTLYQHILENSYPAKRVCQNYHIFWF
jgi:hypothetical protein